VSYFKRLPAVLRRDRNYVHYLVSQSIASLGAMASGFFMVYGKENVAGALEQVGILTAILIGTQAVMNLLWGLLADRRGHKIVLTAAAAVMAVTALVGWMSSSLPWLWATFALLSISTSANSVSRMNIILEFCEPEDRPTYIGLTNTLLAPAQTLAPILGGALATWLGYRGMFLTAAALSVLGAAFLMAWVKEPRHAMQGQSVPVE
jgi:MFS family permease